MKEIEKIRKKLKKESEKNIEIDDSDIPVHEKFVREEHIKRIKKKKSL
jgi:hypothetical protein